MLVRDRDLDRIAVGFGDEVDRAVVQMPAAAIERSALC